MAQAQEIRLSSLDNGPGLLPFKLGTTRLISHFHTFLQDVDIEMMLNQVHTLQSNLSNVANIIADTNLVFFKYQINHLLSKLDEVIIQIDTFLPNRVKRGLLNPLGSLIKEITGNLDHNDAIRFENAIQILNKNEQNISDSFSKHITLSKEMSAQQFKILNDLRSNQLKLKSALADVINLTITDTERNNKYAEIGHSIFIINDNVQDLTYEISRLENILAFSRTKSMHHSVLSLKLLQHMIHELRKKYLSDEIISLETRSYYDIINLGTYFSDKRLVLVLKFPIIFTDIFELYRLCPTPNKLNEIILPSYPFIASNSKEYVYIEAECPKVSTWYMCEPKIGHQLRERRDCIHHLINTQEIDETCSPTPVSLSKEALTELDSQNYIISFPRPTKVHFKCNHDQHKLVQGSYLARVPHNCMIKAPEFTIVNTEDKILGQPIELTDMPWPISTRKISHPKFNLTTIDLTNLHNIQKQLATEEPMTVEKIDASLYHTTIPLYVIAILSAFVLSITYMVRKRAHKRRDAMKRESSTQADIQLNEQQDKRDAAFALNICK